MALKRSQLERTSEMIEATVIERTRELEASQELFQSFMHHSPTLGFIIDEYGKGVWIKPPGRRDIRHSAEGMAGDESGRPLRSPGGR